MLRPAREITAVALCLIAGSCAGQAKTSGKSPENPTREPSHDPRTSDASRVAEIERRESLAGLREPTVETVDPAATRIGVVTTHQFHLADCTLLKGVPTADQIRFSSKWDALDTGYGPCEVCRSQN